MFLAMVEINLIDVLLIIADSDLVRRYVVAHIFREVIVVDFYRIRIEFASKSLGGEIEMN